MFKKKNLKFFLVLIYLYSINYKIMFKKKKVPKKYFITNIALLN